MAIPILLTRPQRAAQGFVERVRARLGDRVTVIVSPLIQIEHIAADLSDLPNFGAVVITSAHAIPAVARLPDAHGRVCYCVGAATTEAALGAGLRAIDGGGDAGRLVERILSDRPAAPVLYARGDHVATDLATTLVSAGIETVERVVYRQDARPLTPEAQSLLDKDGPVIVPLFSPRSARLFFRQTLGRATLYLAVISDNVAQCVPANQGVMVITAQSPSADAMLDAIEALASTVNRVESGPAPK